MDRQKMLQATTWLQELTELLAARKQARWQAARSAGEHKPKWQAMVDVLDNRIAMKESQLAQALGIPGFRAKREV